MKKEIIIQRVLAGFLLSLFVLAITPKQMLHDAFADHKDETAHCMAYDLHIHKATVNCHCDDIVVHTPYVAADVLHLAFEAAATSPLHTCYLLTQPKGLPAIDCLRGPPASPLLSL